MNSQQPLEACNSREEIEDWLKHKKEVHTMRKLPYTITLSSNDVLAVRAAATWAEDNPGLMGRRLHGMSVSYFAQFKDNKEDAISLKKLAHLGLKITNILQEEAVIKTLEIFGRNLLPGKRSYTLAEETLAVLDRIILSQGLTASMAAEPQDGDVAVRKLFLTLCKELEGIGLDASNKATELGFDATTESFLGAAKPIAEELRRITRLANGLMAFAEVKKNHE